MGWQLALDFGTSNTVPCITDVGDAIDLDRIVHDAIIDDQEHLIASMVAYQGPHATKHGHYVRARLQQLLDNNFEVRRSIKTHLRRATSRNEVPADSDLKAMVELIRYSLERTLAANNNNNGTSAIPVVLTIPYKAPRAYRRELINALKSFTRHQFTPAFFVCEPTAALFSFFSELKNHHNQDPRRTWRYLVFDWGGGTLDISVVRACQGRFLEMITVGRDLAGDNIDELLAKEALVQCANGHRPSAAERDSLDLNAENLKIALSSRTDFSINLPWFNQPFRLNRSQFESMIRKPILEEVITLVDDAMDGAHLRKDQIDTVFMVGGSAHIPAIRQLMQDKFGQLCVKYHNNDRSQTAVARGAAKLAALGCKPFLAWEIGLWLCNGDFYPLLDDGTPWNDFIKESTRQRTFYVTDPRVEELDIPIGYEAVLTSEEDRGRKLLEPLRISVKSAPTEIPRVIRLQYTGLADGTLSFEASSFHGDDQSNEICLDQLPWGLQIPDSAWRSN